MADEELLEEEEDSKSKKKKKKKKDKGEKFDAVVGDNGTALYTDADDEEESGGLLSAVVVVFIVLIWLAILALLVKLDVGGFGSGVLYPVFKDVPVINKILPENIDEELEEEVEFASLDDALAEIRRLREHIKDLEETDRTSATDEEVAALKEEIRRLQTFEDSQVDFQKLKTEFYEEVVFAETAPSVEEYKKYYEEIDPDNAEYIYRQVVKQIETDQDIERYVKTYSEMKPKQAAAIFEQMTDNLNLVARILKQMDTSARAKILGVMDSEVASQVTKILDPEY
ncbi:MAG: hypothetical protein Q4D29_07835 [Lachnospiraceae bacterium]|nr:hypothetical protein [Lachnospiraceae bacterium]